MIQLSEYIKSLFSNHKDEIATGDFDRIYKECIAWERSRLSDIFVSIGVNPMEHVQDLYPKMFNGCTKVKQLHIPPKFTNIPDGFAGSLKIETLVIPEGVMSVDTWAFESCDELKSIKFPSTLVEIWGDAFSNCYSLTNIELPEGLTHIHDYAFCNCNSLEKIKLPSTLRAIKPWAFGNCPKLKEIEFNGTKAQWIGMNFYKEWRGGDKADKVKVICTDEVFYR